MTTIVGNKLNSANKKILDRMNKMDIEFIRKEAQTQIEAGAEYIEINALSLCSNESALISIYSAPASIWVWASFLMNSMSILFMRSRIFLLAELSLLPTMVVMFFSPALN